MAWADRTCDWLVMGAWCIAVKAGASELAEDWKPLTEQTVLLEQDLATVLEARAARGKELRNMLY